MPIPFVQKIDPRDLQKNIAIGISLPLNGNSVFNQTTTTQDQIRYNIINLILTNKGERVFNPEFGSDVRKFLFEAISDDNLDLLKDSITQSIALYIPQIIVGDINIDTSVEHLINITVNYQIILSGNTDSVNINFT